MALTERIAWRAPALGEAREIEVGQARLRCYEAGNEGPALVFVHGMLANANIWRTVVERLSPRFRCISIDLPMGGHVIPTHGADLSLPAMARMVTEVIEALGLESATLVGNDSGTAVCQIAATRHEQRVDGLVLTSGDYKENCPATIFKWMSIAGRIPGSMLMYLGPAALLPIWPMYRLPISYGWLIKHPPSKDVMDTYFHPTIRDRAIRKDMHAFATTYRNPPAIEAAKALPRFEKPVLLAWSREDRYFPAKHAEELARILPDARLHWIDDSYTISGEDQPDRLADLIATFMDERAGVADGAAANGTGRTAATSSS